MGLTGLEPVTLRLSSACSNQLSYRPSSGSSAAEFRFSIADFRFCFEARFARIYLNRQSKFANRKSSDAFVPQPRDYGATAPKVQKCRRANSRPDPVFR